MLDSNDTADQRAAALANALTPTQPLRFGAASFTYTDGSVIADPPEAAPGIGAGVYIPVGAARLPRQAAAAVPAPPTGGRVGIDPSTLDRPCDDTISRAELTAIWWALQSGYTKIATDSLGSICQIRRIVWRPQDQTEHRHRDLLIAIRDIIDQHPDKAPPIEIYKVTSHTGIHGNEQADDIATGVATGR
jgi:ribonuclease HI